MPPANPLVPVSWGELVDKITILEIKSARLTSAPARANVGRELALLLEQWEAHPESAAHAAALKQRLRAINEALWELEDRVRAKEASGRFDQEFIEAARAIYHRNDERAAVKRRVNELLGSALFEEKQYQAY